MSESEFILIDLVLCREVSPNDLVSWLDGTYCESLKDFEHLKVEFVPKFLNYLRDQSSGLINYGLNSGLTPSKIPGVCRAIKYVSPNKEGFDNNETQQKYSTKAKSLTFNSSSSSSVVAIDTLSISNSGRSKQDQQNHSNKSAIKNHTSPVKNRNYNRKLNATSTPKTTDASFLFETSNNGSVRSKERKSLEFCGNTSSLNSSSDFRNKDQRCLGDFVVTDTKKNRRRSFPVKDIDSHSSRSSSSGSGGTIYSAKVSNINVSPDILNNDVFPVISSSNTTEDKPKKRINPTRVSVTELRKNDVSNQFTFDQSSAFSDSKFESKETSLESERELLKRNKDLIQKSTEANRVPINCVKDNVAKTKLPDVKECSIPNLELVTKHKQLETLSDVYSQIILYNMVPNIMVELFYILQLLTATFIQDESSIYILGNVHNCIYFASLVLQKLKELLRLLDRGCLGLLMENSRLKLFNPDFVENLNVIYRLCDNNRIANKPFIKSPVTTVSFQSDTDSKTNFPNETAFHVFRKQRDKFYEVIRDWKEYHTRPDWNFTQVLGSKVKHILSLREEPTNLAHFARLFQSQLINMCKNEENSSQNDAPLEDILSQLKKQHPEKFKALNCRMTTSHNIRGPCPTPSFPGSQEFFRDFILAAHSHTFNIHLKDIIISQIIVLNKFEYNEDEDEHVRLQVWSSLQSLKLLAKFLGFLQFLPYTSEEQLKENIIATHISIRNKGNLPLNLISILQEGAANGQLVLTISWIVDFLSMGDSVALHCPKYITVIFCLIYIYKLLYIFRFKSTSCCSCYKIKTAKAFSPANSLLLKLQLGWLFDLPNFPAGLFFSKIVEEDMDPIDYHTTVNLIIQNYSRVCVDCMRLQVNECTFNTCEDEANTSMAVNAFNSTAFTPVKTSGTSSFSFLSKKIEFDSPLKPCDISDNDIMISPLKTPSKFFKVSMLETPQSTPIKTEDLYASDSSIDFRLDSFNFADFQIVSACCPYICDLKTILSVFNSGESSSSIGGGTFRKITPLTASPTVSAKNTQDQKQLQNQLEENFYHNQPSSVRTSVEFLCGRGTSYVEYIIRKKVIPELKQEACQRLNIFILNSNSDLTSDQFKDQLNKEILDVCMEMSSQIRIKGQEVIEDLFENQLLSLPVFIFPPGSHTKAQETYCKLVRKKIQDKIQSWLQSRLTPDVLTKDLASESNRMIKQAQKQQYESKLENNLSVLSAGEINKSTASDPSNSSLISTPAAETSALSINSDLISPIASNSIISPINKVPLSPSIMFQKKTTKPAVTSTVEKLPIIAEEHNPDIISPSTYICMLKKTVYETLKNSSAESKNVTKESILGYLNLARDVLTQRQDVSFLFYRALENLFVEYAVILTIVHPDIMTKDVMEKFISLWSPISEKGLFPKPLMLSGIVCSKNINLLTKVPDQNKSWGLFESLIIRLISIKLISINSLQDQCISLLQQNWPDEVYERISTCIKGFASYLKSNSHLCKDPSVQEFIHWITWFCDQMSHDSEQDYY